MLDVFGVALPQRHGCLLLSTQRMRSRGFATIGKGFGVGGSLEHSSRLLNLSSMPSGGEAWSSPPRPHGCCCAEEAVKASAISVGRGFATTTGSVGGVGVWVACEPHGHPSI